MKDFYPLTPYAGTDNKLWVAWQFHDDEKNAGVVQAFRRGESFYESASLKLHTLDARAIYVVTDFDDDSMREFSGEQLMRGLSIAMPQAPAAKIFAYVLKR